MKRTFQKGNRVWSVENAGKHVTTTWGVAGGKTNSKSTSHDDPHFAAASVQALARQKLQAGYAETTFRGDLPLGDPTARSLLAALGDDPDDLAAHMAFADWLGEQADDRLAAWGEFIRLQLAPAGPPDRKRLAQLRDAYEIHWLGEDLAVPLLGLGAEDLADRSADAHEAVFRNYARGWLDSLTVCGLDKELARAMAKAPALCLLRALEIHQLREEGALAVLAKSSVLANVRSLKVTMHRSDAGLTGLVRSLPRLKSLCLAVEGLDPARLFAMPELSSLDTLEVSGPTRYQVKKLAANPALANLRRLALNVPTGVDAIDDYPGYLGNAEIRAICYSPHLRGLKQLALHSVETDSADGWRPLAESGILARLDLLDLIGGDLDEHSAEILAASPDFARVPSVVLNCNFLPPATVLRLRGINEGVWAQDQRDPREEFYDDYDNDWE